MADRIKTPPIPHRKSVIRVLPCDYVVIQSLLAYGVNRWRLLSSEMWLWANGGERREGAAIILRRNIHFKSHHLAVLQVVRRAVQGMIRVDGIHGDHRRAIEQEYQVV